MRVDVKVAQQDTGEWMVSITWPNTSPVERTLAWAGPAGEGFPLPTDVSKPETSSPQPGENFEVLAKRFCHASQSKDIEDKLIEVRKRTAQSETLARALGRYLFLTLLGDDSWTNIINGAKTLQSERIDLVLDFPPGAKQLFSLPCELMHDKAEFLARQLHPAVTLCRQVTRTAQPGEPAPANTILPRVLFVIGTDLGGDVEIGAGAEYLGVLRCLEDEGVSFHHRVLVRATLAQLREAVKRFRPSVVHFICHGGMVPIGGEEKGFLELAPGSGETGQQKCYSKDLIDALREGGPLPAVVVLNACWTAQAPARYRKVAPLAVDLILGGIPIVIGMAGKVADGACRMFSRSFYQALFSKQPLVEAAARGRRAALRRWAGLVSGIDWASPTLFVAAGTPLELEIDPSEVDRRETVHQLARDFLKLKTDPRAFCGRLQILERAYQELVDGTTVTSRRILALEVKERDKKDSDPRFGKSRTLYELGAKAARDGHLPLILFEPLFPQEANDERVPSNLLELTRRLRAALLALRTRYQAPILLRDTHLGRLEASFQGGANVQLPTDIQNALDDRGIDSKEKLAMEGAILSNVLLRDLRDLAGADLNTGLEKDHRRIVVLLDNLHEWGSLTDPFLRAFLYPGTNWMRDDSPVRVIFTYSSEQGDEGGPGYGSALKAITTLFEQGHVLREPLDRFKSLKEDLLPYTQWLLRHDRRLVVSGSVANNDRETCFDVLDAFIGGIPSQMKRQSTMVTVPNLGQVLAAYSRGDNSVLIDANDEEALKQMVNQAAIAAGS